MAEQDVIQAIYDLCNEAVNRTWGDNLMSQFERLDALKIDIISIMGIAGGALLYKKEEKINEF